MMRRHAVNLAVLAAALSLCLVIAELVLRAIGFSFWVAPERIEFGWPDPEIIENYYEIDVDLFWVGKEYRDV